MSDRHEHRYSRSYEHEHEHEPHRKIRKHVHFDKIDHKVERKKIDRSLLEEMPDELELLCTNPLCNHKSFRHDPSRPEVSTLKSINTIDDLISIGKTYHCKKNRTYYGLNLRVLCNLVKPLSELQLMVGLKDVKTKIVDQILYFVQNYDDRKCNSCVDCRYHLPCMKGHTDMLHVVITGSPGCGKTELAKIIGKIYKEMGILSKGTFRSVTRSDLIGEFLGSTAIRTQKVIDECTGGVMFIDECYSLGHVELRDSFSKECIDTLTHNLSERRDMLCIIAGYENDLDKCFFKFNDGLKRRFPFRYDLTGYSPEELVEILKIKIKLNDYGLSCTDEFLTEQIKKNIKYFPYFGGDVETFVLNCKIAHGRKIIFDMKDRNVINDIDVKDGMKSFMTNKKDAKDEPPEGMYS